MPITPTYPGVYIEEIPSGVRTITGVATSITAFIGRAWRGPVNDPITINSYGDYERIFGGLWVESSMSFAVQDFYRNGGSQAIIVRLYHPEGNKLTSASIDANGLILQASYPGAWGNFLRARIDHDISPEVAERYDLEVTDLFNLTVRDTKTGLTEEFRNVSIVDSRRQVTNVLANESRLVRVNSLPGAIPAPHLNPPPGQDVWGDNNFPTNSLVGEPNRAFDGETLNEGDFTGPGKEDNKQGLYALKKADLFNLLCIPPYVIEGDIDKGLITAAATYCEERRAMLLIDPPSDWMNKEAAKAEIIDPGVGTTSKNAAIFFPRLRQANLLRDNQIETFAPCGAIAGIFARTDAQRGVWKAPAGLEATLNGVPALSVNLTDAENGELNPLGINCLRSFPGVGRVVWGSRTLQGADRLASEWKYIPVRRLTLFLEESLYRGTQWVVFEPNDEPLWSQIRLNIGAFMNNLFRQGAFQGKSPREAYFVKCDKETTTQNDIDLGIVNIIVGFAPLKPAEFVIIKFQQIAGNIIT
jgi:hypothetical protein